MKVCLIWMALGIIVVTGCGDGSGTNGRDLMNDMAEDSERTPSAERPGGATTPATDASPMPELAPVYSAKITKVDVSPSDKTRFNVETIFTSAQGRTFTATVFSDGGVLIHEETIPDVPDAYYSHVFSFNHSGDIDDLNVEIMIPDEKTILDKWEL